MLGFSLARISYVDISGKSSHSFSRAASPGEWYWYHHGLHRVGITLHLVTVLPAGLLMVWQFVPAIRHKFLLFHRINGYTIILLVLLGNIGAMVVVRRAFGGTLSTQTGVGLLVILTTTGLCMAYYNIKRLQIDQHRAWMLRTMFWLGAIISERLIMLAAAKIVSLMNDYYIPMTCGEIVSMYSSADPVQQLYPDCAAPGATDDTMVVVQASYANGLPDQIAASLRLNFGMSIWLAFFLHTLGVELYLKMTPRESNRLRQASYERQMEKGLKPYGSAGLVIERWGDAEPWKPTKEMATDGGPKAEGDGDQTKE